MRAFIFLTSVVLSATLMAALPANAAGLAAATEPNGGIVLRDGERTVASFLPKTAPQERESATAREQKVAGHAILEVRVPVKGERRQEVWIAERAGGDAKVIWWDFAGALDPDGETSTVVQVGEEGIQVYQTAARISRCDGLPVRLAPRSWDFGSRSFKAQGPALPARAATTIQARRGDAPDGKPLGGFFFSAASTSPGTSGDPGRLRPPAAVNDGDPTTVWSSEGDARGHLLTARSSGGFPITGLRLLPGDPSNDRSFRSSGKPRKLSLIFGKNAADTVDVDLMEDADGGARRSRAPFWIALPKPVSSGCVTVMVRETTSGKTPVSIAELDVLTEIDGSDAAEVLVASLAQGTACEARQPILVRLGEKALPKVTAAIAKAAPGTGRECLVQAMAALLGAGAAPSPEVAAALTAVVEGSSAGEEKVLFKLVPGPGAPSVASLAAVVQNDKRPIPDRIRAARLLAAISGAEATAALLAAAGQGDPAMRKSLRSILSGIKPPAALAVKAALDATPAGSTTRRADLLLVLSALARREAEARPAALAALGAALGGSFEEQARAIAGLGLLGGPEALAKLVDLRTRSPNGVLRSFAIDQIATYDDAAAIPALRAALDDADPRVREAAAVALGEKRDKGAADLLVAGAKQEPWPGVRRAEVAALGQLCTPAGNQLIQRAMKRDVDDVRQVALVGLAHCFGAKANQALLFILGRQPESADMRSTAARLLAERRDPTTVPGLAEALVRLVRETEADMSLQTVIADTAMALAAIRSPQAIAALAGLLAEPDVSVKRIGIDALGMVCDPTAGAAALRAAAQDKDEAVSIPAATAEAHCRDRR